ncbi:MAG TPA: recombinase family protein [Verrucomicrobiae bacterium]|nr:recombinase family protein [Verrucomicrobiae bacterium]
MKPHPQEAPPKSVGIWIRVSTEDQAQGDSPKHHETRARHYAAAKGWHVVEVYDLAGVSGKAVNEHPECKRMLDDIRRGHITGLIFSKLARLTRNARELMDFADFFREHNADLISLQENIDTGTPSGRLFYNIVAVMAQWEREEISDRVKASVVVRAKLGKPLGGAAPFGYRWQDKKLAPDPNEAPVRKLMYELYAEHRRKKAVARILNERGFRTRDGSKFSDTTVDRLIQDPTAKGVHRANYTRSAGENKAWALKPEHEWVLTPVEPIVSEELWQQCNDLLETRKTKATRLGRRPVHLFSGLISCACGTRMYVSSGSPKYACASCKNRIPAADVEGIFLDELKGYLLSPDKLAEYLSQTNATISEKAQLLDTLRKELEQVKAEADKAYNLYMANGLTIPQFKAHYQPLDARKTQIEAEVPRLEAELDILRVNEVSTEEIMAEAKDLQARWPTMAAEERRKIVELLVSSIVVGKDEVTLNLCYKPSFRDTTKRQHTVTDSSPPPS